MGVQKIRVGENNSFFINNRRDEGQTAPKTAAKTHHILQSSPSIIKINIKHTVHTSY